MGSRFTLEKKEHFEKIRHISKFTKYTIKTCREIVLLAQHAEGVDNQFQEINEPLYYDQERREVVGRAHKKEINRVLNEIEQILQKYLYVIGVRPDESDTDAVEIDWELANQRLKEEMSKK